MAVGNFIGLIFFLLGLTLSAVNILENKIEIFYFQHFFIWVAEELSVTKENLLIIFSSCFFSLAYLIASSRGLSSGKYEQTASGDLMIKKIDAQTNKKKIPSTKSSSVDISPTVFFDKIEELSDKVNAARYDLFNLMLDMNGIHSADDAQKSLDSLEESASLIKEIKKLNENGK